MRLCIGAIAALAGFTPIVAGQTTAFLQQVQTPVSVDSGLVSNPTPRTAVIFATEIHVPDATWLQLTFDQAHLGASRTGQGATVLRLTSLADGAVQHHTAVTILQWRHTSAYFNGDTVRLELIAPPASGESRVIVSAVWAGSPAGPPESICGPTDDRLPSDEARSGRALPIGCTAWLINDSNNCFLTAGHCSGASLDTIQFNVPFSTSGGALQHPGPEDQYAVDVLSQQFVAGGIGNDWGYFGCFPNTETGLTAGEAQGEFYVLSATPPPVSDEKIRITGYGVDSTPPEWNQIQQTHLGPYTLFSGTTIQYQTDTTGGNSGSAVLNDDTGEAIGIHTNAGCNAGGGANSGTGINNFALQNALASPQGVCVPAPVLGFSYPDGLPDLLSPGGDSVRVEVSGQNGGTPDPGTGLLHYDVGNGFVTVPMVEISPNVYDAVFPPIECGSQVQYYVSASETGGEEVTDPLFAPTMTHSALSAAAINEVFADDFELDQGWSVATSALDGGWDRGVPIPLNICNRGNPGSDGDGSGQCYLTDNSALDACNSDVDTGSTTLTSPVLDAVQTPGVPVISYWRWFSNTAGNAPLQDIFVVEVSDDGGANWVTLEIVGPSGAEVSGGWFRKSFPIEDFVTPTDQFRIRFTASDTDPQSVVEAAVDGVTLSVLDCIQCPWDLDGSGDVGIVDFLALLEAWDTKPGGPPDFDGGGVGITDFLELLANWGPCP